MPRRVGRRGFVTVSIAGALGVACGPDRPRATSEPSPEASAAPSDVDALFAAIIGARPDELDALITRAVERGASADAVFEAALRSVLLTRNDGVDIHSMAALVGARAVHAGATEPIERVAPLFFAVHSGHPWSQPRVVEQRPAGHPDGVESAIAAEDLVGADRAMAARLEAAGVEACMGGARELGTRIRGDLHAVIWTHHASGLLELAGEHGPLLVRSLARQLARSPVYGPPEPTMPTRAADPTTAEEIVHALESAPAADLSGLAPDALFGALAVSCASEHLRVPFTTGPSLHYCTALEAYWSLFLSAEEEERSAIVSRAVRRLRPTGPRRGPDLLSLGEGPGDPFRLAPSDTVGAYRAALRVCAQDRDGFVRQLRAKVARHGGGEHDYKFFGSLLAIEARLPSEEARVRWLASAVAMNVLRSTEPWPHHAAAAAAARG